MREVEGFLAAHSPFDTLPTEVLAQTAATVEVRCYELGTRIISQGGHQPAGVDLDR